MSLTGSGFSTGSEHRSGSAVAKSALEVDGGDPPAPQDAEHGRPEPGLAEPQPLVQPLAPELEEWAPETVRTLVALPFMAAHLVARRRGPADAWMPDDEELELMAGPLLRMANRYSMLRALARFGDPIAFAAATGTYTVAESRRIALWRLQTDADAWEAPDADLAAAGLHVVAERPGEPATVRPWRPPVVPEEA